MGRGTPPVQEGCKRWGCGASRRAVRVASLSWASAGAIQVSVHFWYYKHVFIWSISPKRFPPSVPLCTSPARTRFLLRFSPVFPTGIRFNKPSLIHNTHSAVTPSEIEKLAVITILLSLSSSGAEDVFRSGAVLPQRLRRQHARFPYSSPLLFALV